jgi:hypothetical protein
MPSFGKDPHTHTTLVYFLEDIMSDNTAKRSDNERRAIELIRQAYVVMSTNDPGQPLILQLKGFLKDCGVPFRDEQVFHGEDA